MRGRIAFQGRTIDNLLKQTIFRATHELACDWLVSVFSDNAGVVRFDDDHDVCFKVETHNHPSAIDPYGGANTGLGGVIRDALGTGLGAKPICNTDVFCVAPPDLAPEQVPAGVLHPKRVLKGVVAGVRDYGNRMGIPTVNGALAVDPGYLANPLVFCGTVGVLPRGKSEKTVEPGDRIVAIGGRTGRDGIHGATFSSAELTAESETVSGGAVQIGNAITEKMVLDVIVQARDEGSFTRSPIAAPAASARRSARWGPSSAPRSISITRRSSTRGCRIPRSGSPRPRSEWCWPSPPRNGRHSRNSATAKDVEATDLGEFVDTGRLTLRYQGEHVADLSMSFLHEGRPTVVREATWTPPENRPVRTAGSPRFHGRPDRTCLRTGTSAARNGSSASTTTRSRRGR